MKATKISSELDKWDREPCVKVNNSRIGMHKGMVHLLWGPSYSGKTAFCMYSAKQMLLQDENVLYWDTEGALRKHDKNTEHVEALKSAAETGGELILSQDVPTQESFIDKIDEMEQVIKAEDISMAVIDSVIHPVMDMQPNRRSSMFKTVFKKLNRIAVEHDIVMLVTTHVSTTNTNTIEANPMGKEIHRPIGGNAMLHSTDAKFYIEDFGKSKNPEDDRKRVLYSMDDELKEKFEVVRGREILRLGNDVGGDQ